MMIFLHFLPLAPTEANARTELRLRGDAMKFPRLDDEIRRWKLVANSSWPDDSTCEYSKRLQIAWIKVRNGYYR